VEQTDLPSYVVSWSWWTTKWGVLQKWASLSYQDHAKS